MPGVVPGPRRCRRAAGGRGCRCPLPAPCGEHRVLRMTVESLRGTLNWYSNGSPLPHQKRGCALLSLVGSLLSFVGGVSVVIYCPCAAVQGPLPPCCSGKEQKHCSSEAARLPGQACRASGWSRSAGRGTISRSREGLRAPQVSRARAEVSSRRSAAGSGPSLALALRPVCSH